MNDLEQLHDPFDKLGRRRAGLQEISRKKPILANRTAPEIAARIVAFSLDQPAFGQIRVANQMKKLGYSISRPEVRDMIGQIRRANFEQHRPIKKIVRTLSISRVTVRKGIRGHQTEVRYERGVQPVPKLGEWLVGFFSRAIGTGYPSVE